MVTDWLADGREAFGTIDPVGHRTVTVPGLLAQVDYRAQAVDGPFSGPILSLLSGRAPGDGEVAITDGVADLLSLEEGDLISVPAGMRHWFDMGPTPRFTAVRLFTNADGWIAKFTGDAIADRFPRHEPVAA